MGVILRQGLKHSFITLIATVIGMFNVLFIYTEVLSKTELGFFKYLLSLAQLIFPFVLLGFSSVSIRYFSIIDNKAKGKGGLLFLALFVPFVAFCMLLISSIFFKDNIYNFYATHEDKVLLEEYLWYVPLLIFSMTFSVILTGYISNFRRIVIPEILNNLWIKITIPIFAVAYYLKYIDYNNFIHFLVIAYLLSTLGLFFYVFSFKEANFRPNFKLYRTPIIKDISKYAAYSLLGGLGTVLATRIDSYMVGTLLNMESLGIYSIALFIATVIGIPAKSIFNISSPIVAEYWESNNLKELKELYHKTSLNLLIIGVFLLTGIWSSIDLLFEIIPNGEEYLLGKYVVLILGLSKVIDMATGINTHIISYSSLYRFNFYLSLVLALLNIIFNLLLIPKYGIIGVAIATFLSMMIFNLFKCLFVLFKFKMQPFSYEMIIIILLGIITYFVTIYIPKTNCAFINILINSCCVCLIYIPGILYFNLSEDLTVFKEQFLKKIGLNK